MSLSTLGRRLHAVALSSFGAVAASVIVLQGSRFVTDLFLAGVAGPRDYGIWKLVQVYLIFAPLLLIGIPSGINRELPRRVGTGREVGAVIGTGILASAAGLLLIGAFAGALAPGGAPPALVGLALFGWGSFGVACGVLNGLERFFALAAAQLGTAGLLLAMIPLTAEYGLDGFFAQYALAGGAGASFAFVTAVRAGGVRINVAELRALIWVGFPLAVIGLAYICSISIDRLLVAHFLGLEALGLYGIAATVFAAALTLPTTATQYWYPRLLREFAETGNVDAAAAICGRQAVMVGLASAGVGLASALLLTPIVRLLLPEYTDALPAIYALLPGLVFASAAGPYGNLLIALGRTRRYLAAQSTAVTLEVLLVMVAVRSDSIVWVAFAVSASFAAYFGAIRLVALRSVAPDRG